MVCTDCEISQIHFILGFKVIYLNSWWWWARPKHVAYIDETYKTCLCLKAVHMSILLWQFLILSRKHTFYGKLIFFTVFIKACHCILYWNTWIQSTHSSRLSFQIHSNLTLRIPQAVPSVRPYQTYSYLKLSLPFGPTKHTHTSSCPFRSALPNNSLCAFINSPTRVIHATNDLATVKISG
jgi:hypothetical protein